MDPGSGPFLAAGLKWFRFGLGGEGRSQVVIFSLEVSSFIWR